MLLALVCGIAYDPVEIRGPVLCLPFYTGFEAKSTEPNCSDASFQ